MITAKTAVWINFYSWRD